MTQIKIEDVKKFMSLLLVGESFHDFLLKEATITTFVKFTIDGIQNKKWKQESLENTQELNQEDTQDYISWKEIKEQVFSLVKGSKTPDVMKISLKLDFQTAQGIMEKEGVLGKYQQELPDLFLQIRYEQQELWVISGIANPHFTLDKSLEQGWDKGMKQFILQLGVGIMEG